MSSFENPINFPSKEVEHSEWEGENVNGIGVYYVIYEDGTKDWIKE